MNDYNRKITIGREITPVEPDGKRAFLKNLNKIKSKLIRRASTGIRLYLEELKRKLVSRLFWGRSNYHKSIFHILMLSITFIITFTGVANKFSTVNAQNSLTSSNATIGQNDLLQQGGSTQTVLVQNPQSANIQTEKYKVENGDTIDSIAEKFDVSSDTIRWANLNTINPFNDALSVGSELDIPLINGFYYTVKKGQDLTSAISDISATNPEISESTIVEFNNLTTPYTLTEGQKLFIPDGTLKNVTLEGSLDIPYGVFSDPLANPDCAGYSYSRGFTSYHDGVDLARWPECPIEAMANGVVTYAGWSDAGQGFNVTINHGGGIETKYFHGNGIFWVKTGDYVTQGQSIMMMGQTGLATGVHLHFSLWKNGVSVDPSPYVPYTRP